MFSNNIQGKKLAIVTNTMADAQTFSIFAVRKMTFSITNISITAHSIVIQNGTVSTMTLDVKC